MAFANNMTKLLNKIERRLGTKPLNLPKEFSKDTWAEVILDETLVTFSRYFPHKITYEISDDTAKRKGDYWLINEDLFPGVEILGVKDIAWDKLPDGGVFNSVASSFGVYDFFQKPYDLEDIMLITQRADQLSLINNGIYVEFEQPNKLKIMSSVGTNCVNSISRFKVDLFVTHSPNLNTIEPTKMETFEQLATVDVAGYLYNGLKYYDGLETAFSSIDLKLSDLQTIASYRENIIAELKEGYVSASNYYQPLILTE